MVEQRSPKPTVEGSSPSAPANEKQRPLLGVFFVFGPCVARLSSFSLFFPPLLLSFLCSLPFLAVIALRLMSGLCGALLQAFVPSLPPVVPVCSLYAMPLQWR